MRETTSPAAAGHHETPPWDVAASTDWRALPGGGFTRTFTAEGTVDDGSRAAAVDMIGEREVRDYEVETVKQYPSLGVEVFLRMGIPIDSIAAGYAAAWRDATRS